MNRRNPSLLELQLVKNVLAVRDSPCINPLTYREETIREEARERQTQTLFQRNLHSSSPTSPRSIEDSRQWISGEVVWMGVLEGITSILILWGHLVIHPFLPLSISLLSSSCVCVLAVVQNPLQITSVRSVDAERGWLGREDLQS